MKANKVKIFIRKFKPSEVDQITENLLSIPAEHPTINQCHADAFSYINYEGIHNYMNEEDHSKNLVKVILNKIKSLIQITIDFGEELPRKYYEFGKEECQKIQKTLSS